MLSILRSTHESPQLAAAEHLVQTDEQHFIDTFARLSISQRSAMLALPGACKRLVDAACRADRTDAAALLQGAATTAGLAHCLPPHAKSLATLGRYGWRCGKPMLALRHVGSGDIGVATYQARFPKDRQGWARLVSEGLVTPQAFTERFGFDAQLHVAWKRAGAINDAAFWDTILHDDARCIAALQSPDWHAEPLFERLEKAPRAVARAAALWRAGIRLPPEWVRQCPGVAACGQDLLDRGVISLDLYLDSVPRPDVTLIARLLHSGRATWRHQLRSGQLPAAALREKIAAGECSEAEALAQGPVPDALLATWIDHGTITAEHATASGLLHWQPEDPLPALHMQQAHAALGPYLLLKNMRMPAEPRRRRAYALRMLSAHLRPPPAVQAGAAAASTAVEAEVCAICLEDFSRAPAVRPADCSHAPNMHAACLLQTLHKAPRQVCPACETPMQPHDALSWGGSAADADAIAWHTLQSHFASHRFVWCPCPTGQDSNAPCPGGTLYAVDAGKKVACRVCNHSFAVLPPTLDWRRDAKQVWLLIDGLAARLAHREIRVRECPTCFTHNEHISGCPTMHCLACNATYNFSGGLPPYANGSVLGPQTYVPAGGLLRASGAYEGLPQDNVPVPDLHAYVLRRARELGFPPRPQEILGLPAPP